MISGTTRTSSPVPAGAAVAPAGSARLAPPVAGTADGSGCGPVMWSPRVGSRRPVRYLFPARMTGEDVSCGTAATAPAAGSVPATLPPVAAVTGTQPAHVSGVAACGGRTTPGPL